MIEYIEASLREAQDALSALFDDTRTLNDIQRASEVLVYAFKNKRRVFSCGNGGSMCDAMHFAEELSGRYRDDRPPLAATAISDPGHLSCVSNDMGYEQVFSRYVKAHGQAGDVLLALSTSGASKNIIRAAETARSAGVHVIVLSGRRNTPLETLSDIYICTPAGPYADRVQELHIKVLHILIELIERALFPDNYRVA